MKADQVAAARTRLRSSVVAGILVGVAFVSSYLASWGLISPASRAAKCWVQLENAPTSVFVAIILGAAGCLLWITARTFTSGQPTARGISIATFVTVPVLIITLLPFVVLGAYPLSSDLRSDCDSGEPSGIIVSAAALAPLLGIRIAAIVFRTVTKPTSRVDAYLKQGQ